ncbi:hypothetical protein D9M69_531790 [compost metagenome]
MTITLSGRARCSKRAMAAMRLKVRAPLSQMRTSASATLATAAFMRRQASSSSSALPESIRFCDTLDSAASERLASSAWDISSENTRAEPPLRTAISSARPTPNTVLPVPGRPAMMAKFPGRRPCTTSSRSGRLNFSPTVWVPLQRTSISSKTGIIASRRVTTSGLSSWAARSKTMLWAWAICSGMRPRCWANSIRRSPAAYRLRALARSTTILA